MLKSMTDDGIDVVMDFLYHVRQLGLTRQPADERRPLADYPRLPAGTCELAAKLLAAYYPELRVVSGILEWTEGGARFVMDHAWCVRADGVIVDSTWEPPPGAGGVTYRQQETLLGWPPAGPASGVAFQSSGSVTK